MNAGASGLASAVIPMAKAFGLRVITTVLGEQKVKEVAYLNADRVVDTTKEDIAEIRSFAKRYAIEIIPEIDFPGHNHGALSLHPELRCLPDSYGNEICLGGEASMAFVKARYDEALELCPESK